MIVIDAEGGAAAVSANATIHTLIGCSPDDVGYRRMRITMASAGFNTGAITLNNLSGAAIYGVDVANQTAPLVAVRCVGAAITVDDLVSPDGGNTSLVLDLISAQRCTVRVGYLASLAATATAGFARMFAGAGSVIVPASTLALGFNPFPDEAGNVLMTTTARPLVTIGLVNGEATQLNDCVVVRAAAGISGVMALALADTPFNATAVVGVAVSRPAAGAAGLVVETGPTWIKFDTTPVTGRTAYLSASIPGNATLTPPPLSVALGVIEGVSGTFGLVNLTLGVASPAGAGVLNFDSIRAVGQRLDQFPTANYPKGTVAYVGNDAAPVLTSVHDFFTLVRGEALTVDGITVVSSPTSGDQWVRNLVANSAANQKLFWCVDPSNSSGIASDENAGWGATQVAARLVPLLTIEELNRRINGVIVTSTVVFEQLSSFPSTGSSQNGQLTNLRSDTADGYPVWMGFKTQIFSGVISAYTAENPAGNARTTMTVPGISGRVGRLVMNAAGTKSAWIQKDVSANVVGITHPTLGRAVPFTGGAADFVVGETVNVYALPTLWNWPFPESIVFPALTWVEWTNRSAIFNAEEQLAGSSPSIFGTRFDGVLSLAPNGEMDGCLFYGGVHEANFIVGANNLFILFCGILNSLVDLVGGLVALGHNTIDIQNGTLLISGATVTGFTSTIGIAAFDCTGTTPGTGQGALVIQRGVGGRIQLASSAKIYGTGNTGYIAVFAAGTQSTFAAAANCTAVTTKPAPLLVEGVEYQYDDMPIATTNLTGVNNSDT